MSDSQWQKDKIIRILDQLDERKLSNVYHFVLHISGGMREGEAHE